MSEIPCTGWDPCPNPEHRHLAAHRALASLRAEVVAEELRAQWEARVAEVLGKHRRYGFSCTGCEWRADGSDLYATHEAHVAAEVVAALLDGAGVAQEWNDDGFGSYSVDTTTGERISKSRPATLRYYVLRVKPDDR